MTRVNVVLEQRFIHTADGATYDNGHATYAHWQRYLNVFGEVQVVGRSQPVAAVPAGYRRVDGPGVSVLHVPFYQGPLGLLRRLPAVLRTLRGGLRPQDAVIVRLSGLLGHLAAGLRQAQGHPFAAEVVNDPYMGYGPDGTRHPLRPVFRRVLTGLTQLHSRQAGAVQYVTREALQRRYPPRRGAPAFGVSDVHLPPEAFCAAPRHYSAAARRAILVGSLEQPHKAVDIAIEALAQLRGQGQDVTLTVVGDGLLRPALEAQAAQAGVERWTEFVGQRSTPAEVRRDLQEAELFLIPSRTEGLPRALLEAQAQALPAIGSAVGGIPELIPAQHLVPPGDAAALARAWGALAAQPAALNAASARNLALAREYADDVLDRERGAFQQAVSAQAAPTQRTSQGVSQGTTMDNAKPRTILYTTTTAIASLAFFSEHFGHLRRQGWDVHFVTPAEPADQVRRAVAASGATHHAVPFAREISPRRDLGALMQLLGVAARVRPDVINFSTPKAGLLGGLVGVALGVPLRVYFIHGLRSETAATGRLALLRPVLLMMERLTAACAHEVLCVSASNRDEAVALGLVPASKIRVLGAGSPAGIPVERYAHPDPAAVAAAREELNLPEGTPVVGFVARMAPQKGTEELLLAWPQVHAQVPQARLLLVGVPDPANPLSEEAMRAFREAPGLVQVEFEADMSRLYPLMTVHTLPSRHEGLGMVVLEAGAYGVPSVLTDASGVRDAGVPNETCLQVPAGDVPALAGALVRMLTDAPLRERLGRQSQAWVSEHFAQEKVWALWDDFYAEAWAKRQRAARAARPWKWAAAGIGVAALALKLARR